MTGPSAPRCAFELRNTVPCLHHDCTVRIMQCGLLLTQQFAQRLLIAHHFFVLSFSLLSLCPTPGFDWVVCGTTEGLDAFMEQWLTKRWQFVQKPIQIEWRIDWVFLSPLSTIYCNALQLWLRHDTTCQAHEADVETCVYPSPRARDCGWLQWRGGWRNGKTSEGRERCTRISSTETFMYGSKFRIFQLIII